MKKNTKVAQGRKVKRRETKRKSKQMVELLSDWAKSPDKAIRKLAKIILSKRNDVPEHKVVDNIPASSLESQLEEIHSSLKTVGILTAGIRQQINTLRRLSHIPVCRKARKKFALRIVLPAVKFNEIKAGQGLFYLRKDVFLNVAVHTLENLRIMKHILLKRKSRIILGLTNRRHSPLKRSNVSHEQKSCAKETETRSDCPSLKATVLERSTCTNIEPGVDVFQDVCLPAMGETLETTNIEPRALIAGVDYGELWMDPLSHVECLPGQAGQNMDVETIERFPRDSFSDTEYAETRVPASGVDYGELWMDPLSHADFSICESGYNFDVETTERLHQDSFSNTELNEPRILVAGVDFGELWMDPLSHADFLPGEGGQTLGVEMMERFPRDSSRDADENQSGIDLTRLQHGDLWIDPLPSGDSSSSITVRLVSDTGSPTEERTQDTLSSSEDSVRLTIPRSSIQPSPPEMQAIQQYLSFHPDAFFALQTCDSCLRLQFSDRIHTVNAHILSKIQEMNLERISEGSVVCTTCFNSLEQKVNPRFYCTEAMLFPEVPAVLSVLNDFEASLVAPRIPFMRLRSQINPGKQYSIIGNVHNIEVDLEQSFRTLKELLDRETSMFIKLKRRWDFEKAYMDGILDIDRVEGALRFLLNTELYLRESLNINLDSIGSNFRTMLLPSERRQELQHSQTAYVNFQYERDTIVPAEHGFYRDVIDDKRGEWLTFPKIYCGKEMDYGNLSYKQQCLSEFLRNDNRCRSNITKIFYSYMKLISTVIQSSINLLFYKISGNFDLTAREVRTDEQLQGRIDSCHAEIVLRGVPTSPKYWADRKKQLLSMIRQIGPPSFFITLSPEENKDRELLMFLMQQNQLEWDRDPLTMPKSERDQLIANDPIMTVLYTNRKFQKVIENTIKSDNGIFKNNQINDFFYRIEFQKRGSPHIHMLIWCEDISFGLLSDTEFEHYADKYITIKRPDNNLLCLNEKQADLSTQLHRHRTNCKEDPCEPFEKCSKGFPRPILERTILLRPERARRGRRRHENNYDRIRLLHESIAVSLERNINEEYSYQNVLDELGMSVEDYLDAIASSIKTPTVFLKRSASEIMMNNYNENVFIEHQSNMDIQIITDPYGLAEYITGYMMKDQFEKVKMLEELVEQIRTCRYSFRRQLEMIKTKYQNLTKVSAQECAWTLLCFPFVVSSRTFTVVNTQKVGRRKEILKKRSELYDLDPDSRDIYKTTIQEYYSKRPYFLVDQCLADFATIMNIKRSQRLIRNGENLGVHEVRLNNQIVYGLTMSSKRRVLLTLTGDINRHTEKHIMEKLKLFLPWRDEQRETESVNNLQNYRENLETILRNEKMFVHAFNESFELALLQAYEKSLFLAERFPILPRNTTLGREEAEDEYGFEVEAEQIGRISTRSDRQQAPTSVQAVTALTESDLTDFYNAMNTEQRVYLEKFERAIRMRLPFYHLITGCAGTGKSFLIRGIVQKFAETHPRNDADILLTASTGKAAFNINGCTLHTAFGIPLATRQIVALSDTSLTVFQKKFEKLKAIIIDEISLVGESLFCCVNIRLQQIFKTNEQFGGISIIAVGDFQQLRPVKDNWIFTRSDKFSEDQWSLFRWYELNEIMRQRDDYTWANILTKIGRYHFYALDALEIALLESRIFPPESIPATAVFLCYSNAEVDAMNKEKIAAIRGDMYRSPACDKLEGTDIHMVSLAQQLLRFRRNTNYMETGALPSVLTIKIGVKYMLTKNIDVSDGLVNGAVGICKHFILSEEEQRAELPVIKRIYLEFPDNNVGNRYKETTDHINIKINDGVEETHWIAMNCDRSTLYRDPSGRDIRIKRVQIPVVECEALTIHKSQGQTYQTVALGLKNPLDRRLLYVALSRVPSMDGIYLYGTRIVIPSYIKNMSQQEKQRQIQRINDDDEYFRERARARSEDRFL